MSDVPMCPRGMLGGDSCAVRRAQAITGMIGQFDAKIGAADAKLLCDTLFDDMTEESYKAYFAVWAGCAFTEEVKGLAVRAQPSNRSAESAAATQQSQY